jgi:hypothetical protein
MNKPLDVENRKEHQAQNRHQVAVKEKNEDSVTVTETHEETRIETSDEAQKKYQEAVKKYEEDIAKVKKFGKELKKLFQKSQDTFEKQLSYISAGALALSVGFIKDIVNPIKDSNHKWMLLTGWGLLILTLLFNLVSHMLAAKFAKKGAKETEDVEKYDPNKIERRAWWINFINWSTVGLLAGGIIAIVLYITLNAVYD